MKRDKLIKRVVECEPILRRAGIDNLSEKVAALETLDGPGVSKTVNWMKRLERSCIDEADVYKDMTPLAWKNLAFMHPGSQDLRRLRKLQVAIRKAWKS